MQSISTPAARSPGGRARSQRSRLLVVELWGVGDLALAIPFLRAAAARTDVTLLAKPHAAPLLQRFCPQVELIPFVAPWTTFENKYQLATWPWSELAAVISGLRSRRFGAAVSARYDPRDHALMALASASSRAGFPRAGSTLLLSDPLPHPARRHRAEYWRSLAAHLGWEIDPQENGASRTGKHVVIHTGAGRPVREWPCERFDAVAAQLRAAGWQVTVLDDSSSDLASLIDTLDTADRFIGNDSGPGHLAALLGVPTFTIFGPQLPELFAPQHPSAAWIEGAPCPYKPCFDHCRFPTPHCIREISGEAVWSKLQPWLASPLSTKAR